MIKNVERHAFVTIMSFARTLATMCGTHIRIVMDGLACTDGSTIHLPWPRQFRTGDAVEIACGIACHEAAHCAYGTPQRQAAFVSSFPPADQRDAALFYNVVVDIADETRFERWLPKAVDYFAAVHTAVTVESLRGDAEGNAELPVEDTRQVILAAMLGARHSRIRDEVARYAVQCALEQDLVRECSGLLLEVVEHGGRGRPGRTEEKWNHLEDVTRRLIEVFRSDAPESCTAEASRSTQEPSQAGSDHSTSSSNRTSRDGSDQTRSDQDGNDRRHPNSGSGVEYTNPQNEPRQGESEPRGLQRGSGFDLDPHGQLRRKILLDTTGGTAGTVSASIDGSDPNGRADAHAKACFRRSARQLLMGPSRVAGRPSHKGRRLGDVTRLRIDGKAMSRWRADRKPSATVALALDCSNSVGSDLPALAGCASAMAEALKEAGGEVRCWRFGSEVHSVSIRRLSQPMLLGGTMTHLAIEAARRWLLLRGAPVCGASTRKVLTLFTDGEPTDTEACIREINACRRLGIAILVGAVAGGRRDLIERSMPGARVFEIGDDLAAGFSRAIRLIGGAPG